MIEKMNEKRINIPKLISVASLVIFAGSSSAYAQQPNGGRSSQGGKPCMEEVLKFCSDLGRDREAIKSCLMDHYEDLSDTCKERIGNTTQGGGRGN